MKFTLMGALALGFFGAVVGVGCGSDPENPSDSNVEPIAIDALVDTLVKAKCAQVFNCCDAAERDLVFQSSKTKPKNEAECVAALAPVYSFLFDEIKESVKEGRQEYDGKKAASCVSKIKNKCGDVNNDDLDGDPDCEGTFKGKVGSGGACKLDEDCSVAKSSCFEDACRPLGTEGQACEFSSECVSDYCSFDHVCAEKKVNGQACSGSSDCVSDRCDFDTNKCADKIADGAACSFSGDCKNGNCDQSVCAAKRADGAACTSDSECKSDSCDFNTQVCTAKQEPTKLVCDGN